jgi:hypothetical protein
LYSDGFNTISSVGAIYANTSVTYDGIGKGIGISLLLLIVPLFAGVGGLFWNWVHHTKRLSAKQIIVVNCLLMTLTPAYGLLGFADGRLGYRRWWELYLGVSRPPGSPTTPGDAPPNRAPNMRAPTITIPTRARARSLQVIFIGLVCPVCQVRRSSLELFKRVA